MTTFKISLNNWNNNVLSGSYKGFDPAFDCKIVNYDSDITDLNYVLEVATKDQDAINYFEAEGYEQV